MYIASATFHAQLMITLLLLTQIACVLLVVIKGLYRRYSKNYLPAVPPVAGWDFPNKFDLGYSLFFTILSALSVIATLRQPAQINLAGTNAGSLLSASLLQCMFYLPFLIRHAGLPKLPHPSISFFAGGRLVVLALAGIMIPFILLDESGFFRYLIEQTHCPEFQSVVVMFRDGDWGLRLAVAGAAVIMAPICEEIVYRGFIYRILKQYGGRFLAIVLSALLFSVVHGALAQTVPLFIFGVVQCLVYDKSRTILIPIAVHLIYNSLTLLYILYF